MKRNSPLLSLPQHIAVLPVCACMLRILAAIIGGMTAVPADGNKTFFCICARCVK